MTVILRRSKSLWLSAWPLWTYLIFESLAAARFLTAGYLRAIVVTPIVLMAPGSLTIGALFGRRRRPQGLEFVCFAVLLSAIWAGFASLALYACGVLITADSTYLALLVASTVLTVVAEARYFLGRQGSGRRIARTSESDDPDMPIDGTDGSELPTSAIETIHYALISAVAGAGLLAGGLYTYNRLPQPAAPGYVSMAWTGPQITRSIPVGAGGAELHFQVIHRQSETTAFRLSATWLTNPVRALAKPLNINIGPNDTFQGTLDIPPPPDGCTYRVVVTLTALRQVDPLTKKQQAWSLNADVYDPAKPQRGCR